MLDQGQHVASGYFNHLFEDPVSKHSPFLRSWEPELPHEGLGDTTWSKTLSVRGDTRVLVATAQSLIC